MPARFRDTTGFARSGASSASKSDVAGRAISTAEFRAALSADAIVPQKPPYSVLANTNGAALSITLRPWREALAEYFAASA